MLDILPITIPPYFSRSLVGYVCILVHGCQVVKWETENSDNLHSSSHVPTYGLTHQVEECCGLVHSAARIPVGP